MEKLAENTRSQDAAKGGTTTSDRIWGESRKFCVKRAHELWKEDPTIRIAHMCEKLESATIREKLQSPKRETIRDWLISADRDGKLSIPKAARKGGRPTDN